MFFSFTMEGTITQGEGSKNSAARMKLSNEGISAEHINSQDHRISTCHSYIEELIEDEKFAYQDILEINDSGFLRMLDHKGVKSIINVPIKTLNGKIIGILGIDYVKEP